jgi:hydrogenase maturation factor
VHLSFITDPAQFTQLDKNKNNKDVVLLKITKIPQKPATAVDIKLILQEWWQLLGVP